MHHNESTLGYILAILFFVIGGGWVLLALLFGVAAYIIDHTVSFIGRHEWEDDDDDD